MDHTIVKGKPFEFKQFTLNQDKCTMKVGTDGILLGAMVNVGQAQRILDIGAGTGLIAIMCAQRNEEAVIDAVEIDEAACEQANQNMQNSPWADRLHTVHRAIQDYAAIASQGYDLIVSNPPFFSGGTFSTNENRNNVRHTVKLPNGDLLMAARKLLNKEGRFCVILPYLEGLRFQEQAGHYGFYCTKMTSIHSKKDRPVERLILQFERAGREMEEDELVVYNDESYTPEYVELTKAFYRDM